MPKTLPAETSKQTRGRATEHLLPKHAVLKLWGGPWIAIEGSERVLCYLVE